MRIALIPLSAVLRLLGPWATFPHGALHHISPVQSLFLWCHSLYHKFDSITRLICIMQTVSHFYDRALCSQLVEVGYRGKCIRTPNSEIVVLHVALQSLSDITI